MSSFRRCTQLRVRITSLMIFLALLLAGQQLKAQQNYVSDREIAALNHRIASLVEQDSVLSTIHGYRIVNIYLITVGNTSRDISILGSANEKPPRYYNVGSGKHDDDYVISFTLITDSIGRVRGYGDARALYTEDISSHIPYNVEEVLRQCSLRDISFLHARLYSYGYHYGGYDTRTAHLENKEGVAPTLHVQFFWGYTHTNELIIFRGKDMTALSYIDYMRCCYEDEATDSVGNKH